MKLYLKQKMIPIIIIALLFIIGFYSAKEYVDHQHQLASIHDKSIELCNTTLKGKKQYEEGCKKILEEEYVPLKKDDTIHAYFDILRHYSLRNFEDVIPLFIAIPAIWCVHKKLKSGYAKYELMRMSYRDYLKKNIFATYKYSIIMPIFLGVMFLIAYLISGHFDIQTTLKENPDYLVIDTKFVSMLPQFFTVYFLNMLFHSIFWINLGIISMKKSKNIVITIISTLLIYNALFVVSEIFIGIYIFGKKLGIHDAHAYLNFAKIWVYDGISNIWLALSYGIFLAVVSSLVVAKLYKNKESVLMENE